MPAFVDVAVFAKQESGEIAETDKSWLLFEGIETFLYDLMKKIENRTLNGLLILTEL